MKLGFVLLLCGLTYALASPSCLEEPRECYEGKKYPEPGKYYPENEEDLEYLCSGGLEQINCQLEYAERCPNTLTGAMREGIEKYRTAFTKLCDKQGSLREKFLEKGPCLNQELESSEHDCSEYVTEKDYCKKVAEVLKCSKDMVIEACGSDGEEVYDEVYGPKYTVHNAFGCTFD